MRTFLTGAALTLLTAAGTAGVGASQATAASHSGSIHVKKIWNCGFTVGKPGTYVLARSVTDSSSFSCIAIHADHVTLYLNGHTITGSGTDVCIDVSGSSYAAETVDDAVVGGSMKHPETNATLTNCDTGLSVAFTSGTTASTLKIVAPASYGVHGLESSGMLLRHIAVPLHVDNDGDGTNDASGFYLGGGADNVVTKSAVDNGGAGTGFSAYGEIGDTFSWDTVTNRQHTPGSDSRGFYDYEGSRDAYSHNTSTGQYQGFYFEEGIGPVTATYNTATRPSSTAHGYGSYGFSVYEASPHSRISHNTATGFNYDFRDDCGGSYCSVAEKWLDNTANDYQEFGFYLRGPTKYVMTGNVADANTSGRRYTGGASFGFYIDESQYSDPLATFASNGAFDSEYGFYSSRNVIGGKGNVAKRNEFNAHNVEIAG